MAILPVTDWHTSLLDCCSDVGSCCYGLFCCPCLACSLSRDLGQNGCLPLCDILSPAVVASCGIPLCVPPAVLSLRVGMRHRLGIKGSYCKDILTSCVCMWCSWCQMRREWKYRTKNPVVVNVQPAPVMMLQSPGVYMAQ